MASWIAVGCLTVVCQLLTAGGGVPRVRKTVIKVIGVWGGRGWCARGRAFKQRPWGSAVMRHMLLLAAVLTGSCGGNGAPAPAKARTRIIAVVPSEDQVSSAYALTVLAYHGINADAGGSLGVSIGVEESRAEEAIALLDGVPDIRPFVSPNTVSDWPVREWENDLLLDVSIQEALVTHDVTSLLGRILEEAARRLPRSILEKYPVVGRVKWRAREFVHRDMTPATAIEAVVLFARRRGGVRFFKQYVSIFPPD